MSIRARVNGREYTLNWDEFERLVLNKGVTATVDIVEVRQ